MAYTQRHHYLTFHWLSAGATPERGQFGIRFDDATPTTQALVDLFSAPASTFWAAAGSVISQFHRLEFIRLADIGTDGLYTPGTVAYDHIFAGTVPGGGSAVALFPLQTASVMSLHTAMPRGHAHAGRAYLPAVQSNMTSSWNWALADANTRTVLFAALLTALNVVSAGSASVMSKIGAGTTNHITNVNQDLRPDVQRRRASQQPITLGTAVAV